MVKLKKTGGAPKNASYITISAEAKLTNETLHANIAEADKHTPKAHASSHQNVGADEISVAGLSGELADNQPPKAHASSHHGGTDALTLTSIDSLACRIKTGQYTGDGSTGQAITGIGFQPKYVIIHQHRTSSSDTWFFFKHDQDVAALSTQHTLNSLNSGVADQIIALGVDGFTVDDAGADSAPNANGVTYDYMALG